MEWGGGIKRRENHCWHPLQANCEWGIAMLGFYSPCRLREGEQHQAGLTIKLNMWCWEEMGMVEKKHDTTDKLTIAGFAVPFLKSVQWRQGFISIVDCRRPLAQATELQLNWKMLCWENNWEWRGIKKTNSPYLESLQDSRAGDCGGGQKFPSWTEGGPSAWATKQKLN